MKSLALNGENLANKVLREYLHLPTWFAGWHGGYPTSMEYLLLITCAADVNRDLA